MKGERATRVPRRHCVSERGLRSVVATVRVAHVPGIGKQGIRVDAAASAGCASLVSTICVRILTAACSATSEDRKQKKKEEGTQKKRKHKAKRMDLSALILSRDQLEANEFPLSEGPDGKPLIDFIT